MADTRPFYQMSDDGQVLIFIKALPNAKRPAIGAVEIGADGLCRLKIKVSQPPEDGAANAAIQDCLAKLLKIPSRDVAPKSGEQQRLKAFTLRGDIAGLLSKLAELG